jgi:diacyltrehalose acyltransferase
VVSLANAVMGMAFVHGPPISAADPASVPEANTAVRTNSLGGTVVTHLVPTEKLPLTRPLRLIGVPDKVVDRADRVLRPIIDSGYRRHDAPGDSRPYFADGEIHRNVQSQQLVREQASELVEKQPGDRQQRRHDLGDQLERGLRQLTDKIAEWRGERRTERVGLESDSGQSEQPE